MALKKRGETRHTHFFVNGQRFRQSLETSDWREAQAKEKELIARASQGEGKPFAAPQACIGAFLDVDYSTVGNYIKMAIGDRLLRAANKYVRRQTGGEYILDFSKLESCPSVQFLPDSLDSPDSPRQYWCVSYVW